MGLATVTWFQFPSLYLNIRWFTHAVGLSGIGHLGDFVCVLASVHICLLLEGMKVRSEEHTSELQSR